MGGGTKKVTTMIDGIRKHRFHALAQPSAGMTCFLLPVPAALAGMTYLLMPVSTYKAHESSLPCHSSGGMCVSMESMGGGTKKVTTMIDGIRKHRFPPSHRLT